MTRLPLMRLFFVFMLVSVVVQAATVRMTFSGVGSGTLNGVAFTNQAFSFQLATDSSLVTKPPCCNTRDTQGGTPTLFSIANTGSGYLKDNQIIYVFPNSGDLGLAHYNSPDVIDIGSPALVGYDFLETVAPITAKPFFVGSCPGLNCTNLATSAGPLVFNAVSSVTYSAVVGTASASPTLTSVVDAATGSTNLAPGSLVLLNGTNLGTSADTVLPLVSAGEPLPVLGFNNSGQVLTQIPYDAPLGTIVIGAQYGNSYATVNATITSAAPVLYPAGSSLGAADSSGTAISPTNLAVPGTPITVYAVGLGATNPPLTPGIAATGADPTVTPVQVSIGGVTITPDYAGAAAGKAGVYQVTFRLPVGLWSGTQAVSITEGTTTSNAVLVNIGPAVPQIAAVVNGATFLPHALTPNSFISIFAYNLGSQNTADNIFPAKSFNGVSVLFNGVAAPLYYVIASANQINLVLPSELPASGTVSVQVANALGSSAPFTLNLAPSDPGMFRIADPSNAKRNNGAVLFANTVWRVMPASMATAIGFPSCAGKTVLTVCGQPASAGDSLQVYLTGLGKATPNGDAAGQPVATGTVAPVTGSPLYKTVTTPTVTVGGVPATVLFSGITPGNAGLYQLNLAVPAGVQASDDVAIVVTMPGGATDTVTIGVK
jgi:uncharacterized protein (TIGR03437 family)